jgi:hypothetical protein
VNEKEIKLELLKKLIDEMDGLSAEGLKEPKAQVVEVKTKAMPLGKVSELIKEKMEPEFGEDKAHEDSETPEFEAEEDTEEEGPGIDASDFEKKLFELKKAKMKGR